VHKDNNKRNNANLIDQKKDEKGPIKARNLNSKKFNSLEKDETKKNDLYKKEQKENETNDSKLEEEDDENAKKQIELEKIIEEKSEENDGNNIIRREQMIITEVLKENREEIEILKKENNDLKQRNKELMEENEKMDKKLTVYNDLILKKEKLDKEKENNNDLEYINKEKRDINDKINNLITKNEENESQKEKEIIEKINKEKDELNKELQKEKEINEKINKEKDKIINVLLKEKEIIEKMKKEKDIVDKELNKKIEKINKEREEFKIELLKQKEINEKINKEKDEINKELNKKSEINELELKSKPQNQVQQNKILMNIMNKDPMILYKKPTLIGLNNIGATCFMNSTLQCLSQTKEITIYFLKPKNKNEIINNNIALENKNENQLSPVFLELVQNLWDKNGPKSFCPNKFMNTVIEINPLFKTGQDGDAKDFIIFILEQLHKELRKSINSNNNNLISEPFNQYDKNNAFNYFFQYFKNQVSIISDLFYGFNETTNECLNCKNIYNNKGLSNNPIYYNYGIFNCLIFPLEEVKNFKNSNYQFYNCFQNNNNFYQNNIDCVSLNDCFLYNQKTEVFTGENRNYCNMCKQLYDSNCTSKIYISPIVLILILNRGRGNIKINYLCQDKVLLIIIMLMNLK